MNANSSSMTNFMIADENESRPDIGGIVNDHMVAGQVPSTNISHNYKIPIPNLNSNMQL